MRDSALRRIAYAWEFCAIHLDRLVCYSTLCSLPKY